jgi:hypothetical protein
LAAALQNGEQEATMRKILFVAVMSAAAFGCKKKDENGKSDKAAEGDKGGGGAANLPKLTADPDPGAITAADHPPFESVKGRMLGDRGDNGWPKWDLYNLGTKPIAFLAIYGYAYDKDGKQVAKTTVPLSWNGKLAPGGKTDWSVSLGMPDDKVPETAASYEICYSSIKFDGDAQGTDDNARCPDKKDKGK